MTGRTNLEVAIFIDIESRDGAICRKIGAELSKLGISCECFSLRQEKNVYKSRKVKLSIINKPHFFYFHRLFQKFRGTKFIVLDTEGILPGQNRQHVLLEPEGYIHWFTHQANRYKFKHTITAIVGYPRKLFLKKNVPVKVKSNLITVATNFSVLGYEKLEVLKRQQDRKLKLVDDWKLSEYRDFQESTLNLLHKIFMSNSDTKFVVKPHPNDPQDLWDDLILSENVKMFNRDGPISNLFDENPMAHLCLDGCTTILDAYIANIPVITVGKFLPFDQSVLRNLVDRENSENDSIKNVFSNISVERNELNKNFSSSSLVSQFRKEIDHFDIKNIISLCLEVLRTKPKFRIYDRPNKYHFNYWIKTIVKIIIRKQPKKSARKKFNAK